MHKAGACAHAYHAPPHGGNLRATDTYRDDSVDTWCHRQDAPDNCYQFKTSALLMYSRRGIPKDSLKPHDITRSMWYLFTGPPSNWPISIQYLISQSAFGI